jgi:antitoxin (DNA-binding transcriptional repressor) of toxin-antitoxin stability system
VLYLVAPPVKHDYDRRCEDAMPDTPIYKADAELSKLIDRAHAGEEVFVTTPDDHKVRLVPVEGETAKPKRVMGLWKGKIWYAPDWDSPEVNAEIERMFEESEIFPK